MTVIGGKGQSLLLCADFVDKVVVGAVSAMLAFVASLEGGVFFDHPCRLVGRLWVVEGVFGVMQAHVSRFPAVSRPVWRVF